MRAHWLAMSDLVALIVLLGATAGAALVDWWAVATGRARVEQGAKPLVMVALVGVALVVEAEPASARWWFVAALVAGLIGDVLLLPAVDRFLGGLAAFAVGHGLYVVGLAQMGLRLGLGALGLVVGVGLLAVLGRPIVAAVRTSRLAFPVMAYIGLVAAVVAAAIATGRPLAAAGAVAFALSDALLGTDRFVTPRSDRRVWVHVLYHVGQAGLVLGLASG